MKLAVDPGREDLQATRRLRRLGCLDLPDLFRPFRLLLLREAFTVPVSEGRVPYCSHEPADSLDDEADDEQGQHDESDTANADERFQEERSQGGAGSTIPVDDAVGQLPEHGTDERDHTEYDDDFDEVDQDRNRTPDQNHPPHRTDIGRILERTLLLPERPGTKPRHEEEELDVPGFTRKVHSSLP